MANTNNSFLTFNENITVTRSQLDKLIRGRDSLRERIRSNAKENGRRVPKFYSQGSFAMKTTVKPLNGNEFDLDDGIYLQGYTKEDVWPQPQTVHNWIKNSVNGHTNAPVIDKDTCVRVPYAEGYHIDLPSYILTPEENNLAHKTLEWIQSDPRELTYWFKSKVNVHGEQMRRIVKYLKAWKDYNELDLKGIVLTILVGNHIYSYDERDDKALLGTVKNIIDALKMDFSCCKPVTPTDEDLLSKYTEKQKEEIIASLEFLLLGLNKSILEKSIGVASRTLRQIFGDRFPTDEDNNSKKEESSFIKTETPGILRNDGRSA